MVLLCLPVDAGFLIRSAYASTAAVGQIGLSSANLKIDSFDSNLVVDRVESRCKNVWSLFPFFHFLPTNRPTLFILTGWPLHSHRRRRVLTFSLAEQQVFADRVVFGARLVARGPFVRRGSLEVVRFEKPKVAKVADKNQSNCVELS